MKLLRIVAAIPVMAFVVLLVTSDLPAQVEGTPPATPMASARMATLDGRNVGEVLIGNSVVLRLQEPAGGYTPVERAQIVANRLNSLLGQGYTWQDVAVGQRGGETVLLMGNNLLVTVDQAHARLNNTTPLVLANIWAGNMQTALQTSTAVAVAGTQESWPDWTNPTTKIVPIVSVGSPGVGLGFAQITGPAARVGEVKAVLMLALEFQRTARIQAFVPSSTLTGLNRVQGVAVSALLQYQLFTF